MKNPINNYDEGLLCPHSWKQSSLFPHFFQCLNKGTRTDITVYNIRVYRLSIAAAS